ncbi:MAG TPA: hypothetical protein VLC91_10990 [Spongiibacteraceae bacterium]|nr:hypothetical protein [Spongiibacteraceae bacterium]
MKTLKAFLIPIAAAGLIHQAQATPVQYQFTAAHAIEMVGYNPVAQADYLIANGNLASGTFFYDNAVAASVINYHDSGELSNFGLMSFYEGAVSNFSGTTAGHQFYAANTQTSVRNSATNPNDGNQMDGIYNIAGDVNNTGAPVGSGFQGFSIGDYSLIALSLFNVSGNSYLADQSLPNTLPSGTTGTNGLALVFADSNNTLRTVLFLGTNIAEVPIPSTGLLLGSGLLGLIASARRRAKSISLT